MAGITSPLDLPYPILHEALSPPLVPGVSDVPGFDVDELNGDMMEIGEPEDDDPISLLAEMMAMLLKIGEADALLLDIVIDAASSIKNTLGTQQALENQGYLQLPQPAPTSPEPMMNQDMGIGGGTGAGALGMALMSPPPLDL